MIKTLRVVKAAVKRNFRRKEWEKFKKDHDRTKLHLTQLTQKSTFKRDALSDDDDDDDQAEYKSDAPGDSHRESQGDPFNDSVAQDNAPKIQTTNPLAAALLKKFGTSSSSA